MLHQKLSWLDDWQTQENLAQCFWWFFPAKPEVGKSNQWLCALRGKIPEHVLFIFLQYIWYTIIQVLWYEGTTDRQTDGA